MPNYEVTVTYHFDTTYELEADSLEEAERSALDQSSEWKPYSSEKGYTEEWYDVEIEVVSESE